MKKLIKDLKRGDKFKFNDTLYTVYQRYSEWKKTDDPYLKTTDGQLWYYDELEIEAVSN